VGHRTWEREPLKKELVFHGKGKKKFREALTARGKNNAGAEERRVAKNSKRP